MCDSAAAAHLPVWLAQTRNPVRFAPGCYRVEPLGHLFLWIAASVLRRWRLELSPENEARIEACDDLATIERWLDQAVTATSTSEALQ